MCEPINNEGVFVIIPSYNENEVIGKVADELLVAGYNVIVVDDGSTHSPEQFLLNKPVVLLSHGINLGQGAAIQTGIEFALTQGANSIVTFDADGQHSTADVGALLSVLNEPATDIVLGSRFLQKTNAVPKRRRITLKIARLVNFLFTGLLLTDAHNGLRAMTRAAAQKINIRENRMAHATEILWEIKRHDLRYKEIPVTIFYTHYSQAKGQKLTDGFRILFDLFLNKVFK